MKSKILAWLFLLLYAPGIYAADAKTPDSTETWLTFIPIIIFVVIIALIFLKLRKDKVSLKDILSDKDTLLAIKQTDDKKQEVHEKTMVDAAKNVQSAAGAAMVDALKAPQPETGDGKDADKPNAPGTQSVSRLLAFISGLISVGIACSITSFYMWAVFTGNQANIDLNKLTNVLLSLGLGVVPYAFNKISNALK